MVLVKFAYEDLGDDQFEKLIVVLCQKLFGISVQGFAKGTDGGRDAKFVGTAETFPSKTAPWIGTIIIQAKHTNGYNKSFSETDFYSKKKPENTVLAKEVIRIKKLVQTKQLDHYILFSNRRLTGNAESELREYIAQESGLPLSSVYLYGVEQLELWMKQFSDVATIAGIDPIDSPLIISSDDLAEIVEAFAKNLGTLLPILDDLPTRISYAEKNQINNMSAAYALEQQKKYLKDSEQIRTFLAAPENWELMEKYESIVDEFQLKIIAQRRSHQFFDDVMEYLVNLLFNRDAVLRQHKNKRLTRTMLFYMYWNCDIGIGEVNDVKTDQALTS